MQANGFLDKMTYDTRKLRRRGWRINDTFEGRVQATFSPQHLRYLKTCLPSEESDKVVLDVGCSNGLTTEELAYQFLNYKIVGVDIGKRVINQARRRNTNPRIEYLQGDGTKLTEYFGKESIDGIFALNSITFLNVVTQQQDVIDSFVNSAGEVLKPNGLLVATFKSSMLVAFKGEDRARKFYQDTFGFDPGKKRGFENTYKRPDSATGSSLYVAYVRDIFLPQPKELRTPLSKRTRTNAYVTDYFRNWLQLFNQDYFIREATEALEITSDSKNNFTQYGQYSRSYPIRIRGTKTRRKTRIHTTSTKKE